MAPRLKEKYTTEIKGQLMADLELDNVMQVPTLSKIVVNMGAGDAAADSKLIKGVVEDLRLITGQQPNAGDDAQASQRQSINVAVFLGRDLISRWFGDNSVEAGESIIDRFEVGMGRAVTRSGEETIDAQFRIADGVLRDGDQLYLTGEKDIFDFYNAGLKIVFRFK